MNVSPLPFTQAEGSVKDNYQKIIDAFDIGYLPVFFQYLGPFPHYLDYITDQIVGSLKNRKFTSITEEIGETIATITAEQFTKSESVIMWQQRYQHSPQYYHFKNDLRRIYSSNVKMVFLFIALREAVKGWAVAAKKLSPSVSPPMSSNDEKEFIYEDTANSLLPMIVSHQAATQTSNLPQLQSDQQIEVHLLAEYMRLCRIDFDILLKRVDYLVFRVELEKIILMTLPILPNIIFSPINVVLKQTSQQSNYSELLYLLSEHFPQLSVQKVLFSAYLL